MANGSTALMRSPSIVIRTLSRYLSPVPSKRWPALTYTAVGGAATAAGGATIVPNAARAKSPEIRPVTGLRCKREFPFCESRSAAADCESTTRTRRGRSGGICLPPALRPTDPWPVNGTLGLLSRIISRRRRFPRRLLSVPYSGRRGCLGSFYTSVSLRSHVFSGEGCQLAACADWAHRRLPLPIGIWSQILDRPRVTHGRLADLSHFDPQAGWPWMRAAASNEF